MSQRKAQVSVIIPTYNHSKYILLTLDSVFSQNLDDYEIIVVNDGSPDDTAQILIPLVQAGKIRYIEQANQGQAAARNRGLAEASGEFIAFLDDDDLWLPNKLAWQVEEINHDPEISVVVGSVKAINVEGTPIGENCPLEGTLDFESLLSGNPIVSPGQTLVRTSVLRQLGGFNISIWGADDYDLWLRISRHSKIVMFPEVGLLYRSHSSNASKNVEEMFDNCLSVSRSHLRHLSHSSRPKISRLAYRWIYGYVGHQLVHQFKVNVKSARVYNAIKNAKLISKLLIPALKDPVLLRNIYRNLLHI